MSDDYDRISWIQQDGKVIGYRGKIPFFEILKDEKSGRFTLHCLVQNVAPDIFDCALSFPDPVELQAHLNDAFEKYKEDHRVYDPMTGVFYRRVLSDMIENEYFNREQDLSFLYIDVDQFRKLNQQFGHAYADETLKNLVAVIRTKLRSDDMLFRYSGEEFVVLLPSTTFESAKLAASEIESTVAETLFNIMSNSFHLTVTIGVSFGMRKEDTILNTVDRARDDLHRKKYAKYHSMGQKPPI